MTLVVDLGLLQPVKLHLKFGLLGFFTSEVKFRERAQEAALDWLA